MIIKPLVFLPNGRDGSKWARSEIGHGFTCYYNIEPDRPGYSRVEFGVMCHEFGDKEIWFGPTEEAEEAAQMDHVKRVTNIINGVLKE